MFLAPSNCYNEIFGFTKVMRNNDFKSGYLIRILINCDEHIPITTIQHRLTPLKGRTLRAKWSGRKPKTTLLLIFPR